jgi:hypothetical protein
MVGDPVTRYTRLPTYFNTNIGKTKHSLITPERSELGAALPQQAGGCRVTP